MPGNMKFQLLILFVIIITVATRVLPLEMQKRIINEAIRLRQIDLLYLYCGIYAGAVILASILKYVITMLQTFIGDIGPLLLISRNSS